MKKYFRLAALLSSAALLLCACSAPETDNSGDSSTSTSTVQTESSSSTGTTENSTTSSSTPSAPYVDSADKLPRMDGSTSAIPLEIGLKSGFLGISYNEAKELVSHTTTHDSFKRLINGEVDLIFSVPISEEQQKLADDAGVKLFMEPVAREGFVFAVNANNPVDSLTSEQLRKIYSGEITNWSQVGGNDKAILPYQRNKDSGSQNYMTVFMGGTELMPPKIDLVEGMMGSLMDAIAVYDNSAGAIGYSVYSYAAQMYANANKVKFLAVDGVAPSKATMADESYPLLSCTYMIYTDKSPASAKEFAAKALSDEGQGFVLDSGYLPVNGMDVPDKYLPYEAAGTGIPRPGDFMSDKSSTIYLWEGNGIVQTDDRYYEIVFLKDAELQDRINADIRAAIDRLRKYDVPKTNDIYMDGITIVVRCVNGYISILLGYPDNDEYWADVYYQAETITYDLISGKKLEHFSDLFFEGEKFLPDVNKSIAEYINRDIANYSEIEQKQDFSGILGEPRLFTFDEIGLEPDNLYFTTAPFLRYSNNASVVRRYRDMSGIIAEEFQNELVDVPYYDEWETVYTVENGVLYKRFTGSAIHTAEEVKAQDELWYGLQKRAWEVLKSSDPESFRNYNDHRSISTYTHDNYYSVAYFNATMECPSVNFDADTLELITMEMLIGEGWQQYLTGENEKYRDLTFIPYTWGDGNDGSVLIYACAKNSPEDVIFNVPADKINKRYFSS